jgi:hypothetical protein
MPLPHPSEGEVLKAWIDRFMSSEIAKKEFPDHSQRLAVAYSKWRESGRSAPTPQKTLSRYTKTTRRQGAYQ